MGSRGQKDEGTMGGGGTRWVRMARLFRPELPGSRFGCRFSDTGSFPTTEPLFFSVFSPLIRGAHLTLFMDFNEPRMEKQRGEEYGPRIQKCNTSSQDKDREGLRVLPTRLISLFPNGKHSSVHVNMESSFHTPPPFPPAFFILPLPPVFSTF